MKPISKTIMALNYSETELNEVIGETIRRDQLKGFGNLIPAKLVTQYSPYIRQQEGARTLQELDIFLKKRCNASCPECYCSDANHREEPTKEELKSLIKYAKDNGAKNVYTAGAGEPTIDPNFIDLAEYISELDMNWVCFTNGIILSDDKQAKRFWGTDAKGFANRIAKTNTTLIHKLWASSPDENDQLTGTKNQYNYEAVNVGNGKSIYLPKGINVLREAGFEDQGRLALESLCTSKTVNDIRKNIIPFAEEQGIPLILDALLFVGGGHNSQHLALSPEQFRSIESHITDFGNRTLYGAVIDNQGYLQKSIGEIDLKKPVGPRIFNKDGEMLDLVNLLHTIPEIVAARYAGIK